MTKMLRLWAGRAPLYLLIVLAPLALRFALLPWVPVPSPHVHDEFGHLLVSETLAAGRLANPTHPLYRHFETLYILQKPVYASTYPLGQGILLSTGKALFGHPWGGVLLGVSLMSLAIGWMLLACVPPLWAAAGAAIASIHYGLTYHWGNSYWGGSFCAFGGALLFGALCRLRKGPSKFMAFLVGVGWSIVWLIRPFESMLPLLVSWGLIAFFVARDSQPRRRWFGPVVLILLIQSATGVLTGLHNKAVTGSYFMLPYQLSQRLHGVPQTFYWQPPIPPPSVETPVQERMYWAQRKSKETARNQPLFRIQKILYTCWTYYLTPWYTIPLLLLIFARKDLYLRIGGGMLLTALLVSATYPYFFTHYIAAYTCIIVFLIVRGLMKIAHWSPWGKAIGSYLALFLLFGGLAMGLRIVPLEPLIGFGPGVRQRPIRAQVSDWLKSAGDRHVVFVRYEPEHSIEEEWVYNAADIDAAPIVWARVGDHLDSSEVVRYFQGRNFWIADVSQGRARLSRYDPDVHPSPLEFVHDESSKRWALRSRLARE
ncbi:MAG: hypothetical protein ACK5AZ_05345 [Bryobacteraceae bacterium]